MMKLYAPESYWKTPKDELDQITGGCGPGRFGDYLVPDCLFGLSIRPCCKIHDFMYHVGETLEDKKEADRVFLNNMIRTIQAAPGSWLIKKIRLKMASMYYEAVKKYGGPAFWDDKNPDEEFQNYAYV